MTGHRVEISPFQAGPDDLVIFYQSAGVERQVVWRDCSFYLSDNGMQLIVVSKKRSEQGATYSPANVPELRRYNMMHVTEWFYGTGDGKCRSGPFIRRYGHAAEFCEYRAGHEGRCSYLEIPTENV